MRVAVSIGSNLGDRQAALERAVTALSQTSGLTQVRVSAVYETDPVGGVSQPDFLNVVAIAESDDPDPATVARQLLKVAQTVEFDLDRVRTVRWGPRTVDVDILAVGDYESADPELTVPHPRITERAFVLVPWAEVDPDFDIPGHAAVAQLLARLDAAEVQRVRHTATTLSVGCSR